jgi:HlyD family secretion protein
VAEFLTTDAVRIHPDDSAWIEDRGGDKPLQGKVRVVEPGGFTKVSALGVDEQRTNVTIDIVEPLAARPTLADGYRVDERVVVAKLDEAGLFPRVRCSATRMAGQCSSWWVAWRGRPW